MDVDLILDSRASAVELAELGALAEELGFSGIWVSSLLDGRDPFANLSLAAQATRRIGIGPIAVNPWDMHPVRISGALHTLNELSDGRARIVIGGGGEALASLGLQAHRRVRAVSECVEIIRRSSSGQRFDYMGQLYQVSGYELGWLTASAPDVFVAANMPQMLNMAGRVGAGVMLSDMPAQLAEQALETALAARFKADQSGTEFWSSSFAAWHVYDDEQQARDEAKRWLLLRGLFRPWVLQEFLGAREIELIMNSQPAFLQAFIDGSAKIEGIPDELADRLVDHLSFTGTPASLAKVIDRLAAYREAGLAAISLRLYANPAESMRLIAERVLPALA